MARITFYYQDNCKACTNFYPIWEKHKSIHKHELLNFLDLHISEAPRALNLSATPVVVITDNQNQVLQILEGPSEGRLHDAILATLKQIDPDYIQPANNIYKVGALFVGAWFAAKIFKIL